MTQKKDFKTLKMTLIAVACILQLADVTFLKTKVGAKALDGLVIDASIIKTILEPYISLSLSVKQILLITDCNFHHCKFIPFIP